MARAPRFICIKKCWIKNTMFMPGNLVRREIIEYPDAEGKMVLNRHFKPIEDTSQEGVQEALEEAAENETKEARAKKENIIAAAKDKAKEMRQKATGKTEAP